VEASFHLVGFFFFEGGWLSNTIEGVWLDLGKRGHISVLLL